MAKVNIRDCLETVTDAYLFFFLSKDALSDALHALLALELEEKSKKHLENEMFRGDSPAVVRYLSAISLFFIFF